jgi:hypothetical protein
MKSLVLKDTSQVRGFVINPFGHNITITPELIQYFSKRLTEIVIKKDTKVMLGQPAKYPHDMVKALSEFFKKYKEVESAYLFLAFKEGDDKPNLLIIIDFKGEKSELFPNINPEAVQEITLIQPGQVNLIALNFFRKILAITEKKQELEVQDVDDDTKPEEENVQDALNNLNNNVQPPATTPPPETTVKDSETNATSQNSEKKECKNCS